MVRRGVGPLRLLVGNSPGVPKGRLETFDGGCGGVESVVVDDAECGTANGGIKFDCCDDDDDPLVVVVLLSSIEELLV